MLYNIRTFFARLLLPKVDLHMKPTRQITNNILLDNVTWPVPPVEFDRILHIILFQKVRPSLCLPVFCSTNLEDPNQIRKERGEGDTLRITEGI